MDDKTCKSLEDAPEQRAFWEAYSEEMIRHLTKADLIARYQIAVDFDATSRFTPDDLKNWAGRILILEGDNDPIAEAPALRRETLSGRWRECEQSECVKSQVAHCQNVVKE